MHEHIDLHGRYYLGLTEAVQRGEPPSEKKNEAVAYAYS